MFGTSLAVGGSLLQVRGRQKKSAGRRPNRTDGNRTEGKKKIADRTLRALIASKKSTYLCAGYRTARGICWRISRPRRRP